MLWDVIIWFRLLSTTLLCLHPSLLCDVVQLVFQFLRTERFELSVAGAGGGGGGGRGVAGGVRDCIVVCGKSG